MPAWFNYYERIHLAESLAARDTQVNLGLKTPVKDVPLDDSQNIVRATGLPARTGTDNQGWIVILEFLVVSDTLTKLGKFRYC